MNKPPQLFSGKLLNHFWEVWLDIQGLERFAMVSNFGRIFFKQTKTVTDGTLNSMSSPYLRVKINGKSYLVHRLVGLAFMPNPKKKSDINHIFGLKWLNWVPFIEWSTRSENVKHCYDALHRVRLKGDDSPLSKLNEEQREEIKSLFLSKQSNIAMLSRRYKVGRTTISRVIKSIK